MVLSVTAILRTTFADVKGTSGRVAVNLANYLCGRESQPVVDAHKLTVFVFQFCRPARGTVLNFTVPVQLILEGTMLNYLLWENYVKWMKTLEDLKVYVQKF